jgi:hypothetical protein
MAFHRNKTKRSQAFTPEELNFFKRMNPRTDQPIRLAEGATSRPSKELESPARPLNPTYLFALVGFAGILFFLSGAI